MRSREDHYAEADRLLEASRNMGPDTAQAALLAAIGHAVLASAYGDVYARVEAAENGGRRKVKL